LVESSTFGLDERTFLTGQGRRKAQSWGVGCDLNAAKSIWRQHTKREQGVINLARRPLGVSRATRDAAGRHEAIFERRGRAVELQPQSVADPPCGARCCPSCGKAGIRLVAFTDAAGVLHMIGRCRLRVSRATRDAAGRHDQSRILDFAGKKGSANSDGTIPTEDLAGSHKFGANEERQFMDLLPGAANWKQKADSLLMRVNFRGTSISQYTPNTSDYWVREAMSYASRRDYAHALQCLQQARALASGPRKSSLDRVIARIEQNMGR
jgi:hypothetical protein